MLRLQLLPTQHYSFTIDIGISIRRVNWGGHLDNAYLLLLASGASGPFFRSPGYREVDG